MTQWKPWHASSHTIFGKTPEQLKLPTGVDLDTVPQHPKMGQDLASLVHGRKVGEKQIPPALFRPRPVTVELFDGTGHGADTFVARDPFDGRIASVSIGAPADSAAPHVVYGAKYGDTSQAVAYVEVVNGDGSRETFRPGQYEKKSPDGSLMQLIDFDGDRKTDQVNMGVASAYSSRGYPFLGYHPVEE